MAAKGKYAALARVLPRFRDEDVSSDHQAKINILRGQFTNREGATIFHALNNVVDDVSGEISENLADITMTIRDQPMTAAVAANLYAQLRLMQNDLETITSHLNLVLEAMTAVMVDSMEAEDVASLKLSSGHTVSTYPEPHAVVTDRDAIREWVDADPDLRKSMSLPWPTLNSLCKTRLLEGDDLPPGVDAYIETKIRLLGPKS